MWTRGCPGPQPVSAPCRPMTGGVGSRWRPSPRRCCGCPVPHRRTRWLRRCCRSSRGVRSTRRCSSSLSLLAEQALLVVSHVARGHDEVSTVGSLSDDNQQVPSFVAGAQDQRCPLASCCAQPWTAVQRLLYFRRLDTVAGDVGLGVLGPHHLAEHLSSVLRA